MPRKLPSYVYGIIAFCIATVLILFLTSENTTRAIEEQIQAAAKCATFEGDPPVFEKMDLAKQCAGLATENLSIELHTDDGTKHFSKDRESLKKGYLALRSSFSQLATGVSNINILVKSDTANAKLNIRVMGKEPGREDYFLEEHPIEVELVRDNSTWHVAKVRNLDELATRFDE